MTQFSQYGYRKTSMEDLAGAAGISRPSLYSYFENKEEIFRSLSRMLNERALETARTNLEANRDTQAITARIEGALADFTVSMFRLLDVSPHGAELMDESHRLGGDIAQHFYTGFENLVAEELEVAAQNGELNLSDAGISAAEAAEVIRLSVMGLKKGAQNGDDYQQRIGRFIRVYLAGLA